MSNKPTSSIDSNFWQTMKQRFAQPDSTVSVTRKRAQSLQENLPERKSMESVADWIRRSSQNSVESNVNREDWATKHKPTAYKLRYLAQVIRLAADPDSSQYPLPDPGWVYESEDGKWNLQILSESNSIQIVFQSLGFAVDEYANRTVSFWDDISDIAFASVRLDDDGDGICELPNVLATRKSLCQPYILIEENN